MFKRVKPCIVYPALICIINPRGCIRGEHSFRGGFYLRRYSTHYHHIPNTLYCIVSHILTPCGSTTPVTSTPLPANNFTVFKFPVRAASHILLFSSYNNITDNNITLLIQYQSHIHASCLNMIIYTWSMMEDGVLASYTPVEMCSIKL